MVDFVLSVFFLFWTIREDIDIRDGCYEIVNLMGWEVIHVDNELGV